MPRIWGRPSESTVIGGFGLTSDLLCLPFARLRYVLFGDCRWLLAKGVEVEIAKAVISTSAGHLWDWGIGHVLNLFNHLFL